MRSGGGGAAGVVVMLDASVAGAMAMGRNVDDLEERLEVDEALSLLLY